MVLLVDKVSEERAVSIFRAWDWSSMLLRNVCTYLIKDPIKIEHKLKVAAEWSAW